MPFKDISYLQLWWPYCLTEQNPICNFARWHNKEHLCEAMSFRNVSYLQLWWPSCLAHQNLWANLGRRHYQEHLCEIILNLEKWFRRRFR